MLGACAAWLAGVALAATVISHEMSELMDDSLEASARLSLSLYRGAGQVGTLAPGDSAIRIIDGGVAVTDAPWAPVTADGGQDLPGWRVFAWPIRRAIWSSRSATQPPGAATSCAKA